MADIDRLIELKDGVPRGINLNLNSPRVGSLRIYDSLDPENSPELTKALLDKLILIEAFSDTNGKFAAANITVTGTPTNHTPATQPQSRYTNPDRRYCSVPPPKWTRNNGRCNH